MLCRIDPPWAINQKILAGPNRVKLLKSEPAKASLGVIDEKVPFIVETECFQHCTVSDSKPKWQTHGIFLQIVA